MFLFWQSAMGGGNHLKNGKKPTANERKIISAHRLNAENWLVHKHTSTELVISHKYGGSVKTIRLEV